MHIAEATNSNAVTHQPSSQSHSEPPRTRRETKYTTSNTVRRPNAFHILRRIRTNDSVSSMTTEAGVVGTASLPLRKGLDAPPTSSRALLPRRRSLVSGMVRLPVTFGCSGDYLFPT